MILKKSFLLIGISVILVSGCAGRKYPVSTKIPLPLSERGKLLTAHTWKETAVLVHKFINGDTIQYDITGQFAAIDRDDYTVFYPDGTFLFEEGKSRFASGSTQKYQRGTWQLEENESVLSLTFNHATDRYAILALNPFRMVLNLAVQKADANYRYTITYTPEIENGQSLADAQDRIYTEVEVPPHYPGGNGALIRMLCSKQKYPAEARKKGIQGKVMIAFVIHEDGKAGDFEVIQPLGYGCDEAALQTLQTMPIWEPGKQNGSPVKVRMSMPIAFRLD
jgi:TonB family protein